MTAFARKVLGGLPAPNVPGAANNYSIAAGVHQRHRQGGRQDRLPGQPDACRCSAATAGAISTPTISRPMPLPSGGGGNGNIYARNKQLVARHAPTSPTDQSLLEVRFGWSNTQGGKNPPALGERRHASASPGCRPIARIAGGLPSQTHHRLLGARPAGDQPAVAVPDGVEPEGELLVADGPPVVQGGLRVPAASTSRCRTSTRSTAATPTPASSRGPAGAAANNIYNLADFMLGLRSQYALSTFSSPKMRQNMHFIYLQDDIRVNDRLTLNLGLRYEYATPMWEANNVLTNFDPVDRGDGDGQGRIDRRPGAGRSRSQQLRPAPRLRLHAWRPRRSCAAAGAPATCTSTASVGANLLGDQRPAGDQRRRRCRRDADGGRRSGRPNRAIRRA